MAAALRPLLVLDQDRADPHALVALDGVHDVLDVAVAIVAVDKDRQVARRHDVAHRGGDLSEALEAQVGDPIAGAHRRKAADEIGLEADPLDEPRAQRVVRPRHYQQALLLHRHIYDLAKARRHESGSEGSARIEAQFTAQRQRKKLGRVWSIPLARLSSQIDAEEGLS